MRQRKAEEWAQWRGMVILDVRQVPSLETAIDQWLAVRGEYQKQASDENRDAYNSTYFELGEAFAERYPESANVPGEFERFRCGLFAAEEDV